MGTMTSRQRNKKNCQVESCNKKRCSRNHLYCKKHQCRLENCGRIVIEGFELCDIHKCTNGSCRSGSYVSGLCPTCFQNFIYKKN